MNGSILPVTIPLLGGKPGRLDPGMGNCPKRACPGGGKERQTEKRSREIRRFNEQDSSMCSVWPIDSPRDGEFSLSVCLRVGIRLLSDK